MKIIAKTANQSVLIEATEQEVREILNAVLGTKPEKIEIGDKIPAIDYASTITKIKQLKEESTFRNLISYASDFNKKVESLKNIVESASNVEL